jgi:hypothetical protein
MLDRYRVLWFWEALINANLQCGLKFDKLITIKKTQHSYVGYFTVNDPNLYGQIIVRFGRKSFKASEPILWKRTGSLLMNYLGEGDFLIFDNRKEFDWVFQKIELNGVQ